MLRRFARSKENSVASFGSAKGCSRLPPFGSCLAAYYTNQHSCSSCYMLSNQRRAFRIVSLGADTPEDIARRQREAAKNANRKYLSAPDPMLTSFPSDVGVCHVFRNVISSDEEQIIWEELMPVMAKDGTMHFAEATKVDEKKLRNTYLELYGMKPYTDIKNWKKQETKQVPGFVWAPTLVKWLQAAGPEIESWLNKDARLTPIPSKNEETQDIANCVGGVCMLPSLNAKKDQSKSGGSSNPLTSPQIKRTDVDDSSEITGPVDWIDMGRVVEHNDPGYEMHTEHPTTGRYFIYLNLLSDTVLTFDDEASGRVGRVLLPQRSLMLCSSELRWGWRVGEHSLKTQIYEKIIKSDDNSTVSSFKKTVRPDVRLSIQLWKYDPKLADRRHLQSQVESSVRESLGGDIYNEKGGYDGSSATGGMFGGEGGGEGSTGTSFKINAFNLGGDSQIGGNHKNNAAASSSRPLDMTASTAPNLDDSKNTVGLGKLGGDLVGQAEKDAAASSKNDSNSPAVPKSMNEVDKDFTKYKDSFSRLTTLMGEMKSREDAGMKVNDEWLKEKMNFSKDGDEYGFDPVNPERTWENIENKARFYRDRIRSMDYDGTNEIGKPKKKSSTSDPKAAARDTMDAELIIEGVESPTQKQKRLDDDEEGDGVVNGIFEGFGNPNRSPADMRAAMEKLLPKDKADRMLASMPNSFGSGMGVGGGR